MNSLRVEEALLDWNGRGYVGRDLETTSPENCNRLVRLRRLHRDAFFRDLF